MSDIISAYIDLKSKGRGKHIALCPFHDERTPSFWVDDNRGYFRCYGCNTGGDAVSFIMKLDNVGFLDALARAAGILRIGDDNYAPARVKTNTAAESDAQRRKTISEIERAREIWRGGLDISCTLGETYFRDVRKIRIHRLPGCALPISMKFVPAHEYWHTCAGGNIKLMGKFPAIISAMQNAQDDVVGVHQIYLDAKTGDKLRLPDPDVTGKVLPAKKMRGAAWASSIRLGKRADRMGASEGIENGLVYMSETGTVVWAAASLNNLAGPGIGDGQPRPDNPDRRLPTVYPDMSAPYFSLPSLCTHADILKDSDSKDPLSAECLFERAGRRHALLKKEVTFITPPAGFDLNDVVMGKVPA